MCFGGGGGDSKIAKQTRSDEVARQARIIDGMASIDAIFNGTPAPVPPAAPAFGFNPFSGGSFAATPAPAPVSTGGFNDEFYEGRAQDYVDFAMPQVDRQASQVRDELVYALARSGNLDSSAAINRAADLDYEANTARVGVANTGLDQANQLRTQVESTRSNLVAELNATGDSEAASNSALRSVQSLSQPQGYSPLGNLFASFANSLSGIGANAGNGFSGFARGGSNGVLFAPDGGSQRVVGG